ncbi:MAG TPA: two-component system regulatory protein YycI [Ureibacillus sp.]|nr:two-component system regulatory protein YycI [Ureibacillus sp.]
MDWSKSKSIFIVVFLILDIFLYSLYLNRYTEAQKVEVLGEKTIETRLKDDNITYAILPNIETAPYLSGSVKHFTEDELPIEGNQEITIENDSKLIVILDEPVEIRDITDPTSYVDFLQTNIYESTSYTLWNIDEENQTTTFFQRINNQTIYYNNSGMLKLYWNSDHEVYKYEQTLLVDLKMFEEQETLLSPIQVIQVLYSKGLLKPDSHITQVKLGYSTLVQDNPQVFVPTWEIQVKTIDNQEEEFFANAIEGKIIDVKLDQAIVEEDGE